jgi:hypothetical protein
VGDSILILCFFSAVSTALRNSSTSFSNNLDFFIGLLLIERLERLVRLDRLDFLD